MWRLGGSAPAVTGLTCLSPRAYRTLSRLAAALLPSGGAFPLGAADVDLARSFDVFLADEPPWNQRDLQLALTLLEYGPLLFDKRWAAFSSLDDAERLAHYERWATSDDLMRRQVALAFRKFLSMVFYDSPEVWQHIGYDGAAAARYAQ